MSKEIKKGGSPSQAPKQPSKPLEVPALRERVEKASNNGGSGEARRPVMVTPIPTPTKKTS